MRHPVLAAMLLLAAPGLAHADDPRGRPMHEMQGDCANYRTDLRREFALWQGARTELPAGAGAETAAVLPVDRPVVARLLPHPAVHFIVRPTTDRGGPDRFSGILRLDGLPPGQWRVSAANGVWIDLVAGAAHLPAPSFEMQTQCRPIFKTVTFVVPPGAGALFLQLSGSPTQEVEVLVSRGP